jgi:hypothetical protein
MSSIRERFSFVPEQWKSCFYHLKQRMIRARFLGHVLVRERFPVGTRCAQRLYQEEDLELTNAEAVESF